MSILRSVAAAAVTTMAPRPDARAAILALSALPLFFAAAVSSFTSDWWTVPEGRVAEG